MYLKYDDEVQIPMKNVSVGGHLSVPLDAKSIVLFAHGSGSSRFSLRNQMVANYLKERQLGTFLFDLLTKEEDKNYNSRFNIELLAQRLMTASEWLQTQPVAKGLYLSYFGASTGAAAALIAASAIPHITALVSRGGRPDLAIESLPNVKAPTLLIVGSNDEQVLRLNKKAFERLTCEKKLEIVQGATHLFEEPGTMQQVCSLAASWFQNHFQPVI